MQKSERKKTEVMKKEDALNKQKSKILVHLCDMAEIYCRLRKEGVNSLNDPNISAICMQHILEFKCETRGRLADKIKALEKNIGSSFISKKYIKE